MTYRKIIHIDMDAFYASVEQRDNPQLRGIPMAVGGVSDRGVLATASYEARKYGIHSAMSTKKALELCPQLVVVPGDHAKYKRVSMQIHDIFHEYTDIIEPISLDEAFLDVTENKPNIELAIDIAIEIKNKIKERLNLTASAGVSYNKFLAKIASDYNKPDGLYVVHPDRALSFISKLRIEQFWGVGPVTAQKMHKLGIFNGSTLREHSLWGLTHEFGKMGIIFYNFARGIDDRPVEANSIRKSIGCETTFESDIYKKSAVIIELYHVTQELIRRLKKNDFQGYTLTLKVKFHDFKQITRSYTDTHAFTDMDHILPAAKKLLNDVPFSEEQSIRLLGLSVGNAHDENEKKVWRQMEIDFKN